ncbi:MAG: hypothetical protein AABZ63_06100 [Actinomycetota bacterium]
MSLDTGDVFEFDFQIAAAVISRLLASLQPFKTASLKKDGTAGSSAGEEQAYSAGR